MRIFFFIIGMGILFFGYHFLQVQRKIKISERLVNDAVPYQRGSEDFSKSVLILGDSTAAGVGATRPEDSVPALYSSFIGATFVENKAVSGSKIADVRKQMEGIRQHQYAHILLQVGANDIVAYKNTNRTEQELRDLLQELPSHDQLTVIICGNVGAAKIIPWFLRNIYTKKTLEYHRMYERVVPEFDGTYVNLYTPKAKDPFIQEPEVYFSEDQFHPSSKGYALWLEKISQTLSE